MFVVTGAGPTFWAVQMVTDFLIEVLRFSFQSKSEILRSQKSKDWVDKEQTDFKYCIRF